MKYVKRILALPFLLVILLIHAVWVSVQSAYLLTRYGGEIMSHPKDHDILMSQMFRDIQELIEQAKQNTKID